MLPTLSFTARVHRALELGLPLPTISGADGDPPPPKPPPPPAPPEPKPDEPRPMTQADIDRIVQDRLARERAKFADYDDLKEKASKFDELDAASKTELDKAREAAQRAQAERDAALSKASEISKRAALVAAASSAGAANANVVADLLARSDKVTVGDDGTVSGAEDAVNELLEKETYLRTGTPAPPPPPPPGSADSGARTPTPGQITDREVLKTMTPEQIEEARIAGRLNHLLGIAT